MKLYCTAGRLAVLLLFVLGVPIAMHAQTQATIVGTVTDSSGSVLIGAYLEIVNEGTGQVQTVESNQSGDYDDPNLSVGTYTVKCTAPNFKQFEKTHIPLNIGDTLRVDVHMEVGSVSQTLTVESNVVQVQSTTNEVSTLIDSKQISQLDTNGRDISGLVTLSPGVTTNDADFTQPLRSGTFSINGGSTNGNVFLIDGTEDMDRGSDGSNMSPSADALSEFKVLTSNYSADYGFGSGGTIAVALKSGTKHFHGSLWEYSRNDALNANNYFANLTHSAKPELRFNTYGGNLGGPLFIPHLYNTSRLRTFFFLNEEWRRFVIGAVVNDTVPTALEGTGNFSDRSTAIYVPRVGDPAKLAQFAALGLVPGSPFPGNIIPQSLLDPNAQLFVSSGAFPLPNSGSQYIHSANSVIMVHEDIAHVSHIVNDKILLDGHLVHFIANEVLPASSVVGTLPTTTLPYRNPAWNAAFKVTDTIRPNLINQAIFNFQANGLAYTASGVWQQPAGWSAAKLYANNDPLHRLPNVSVGAPYSGVSFGTSFLPYHNYATEFQERDDLFWTIGAHNLKLGGSFSHYNKNQVDSISTQGSSTFSGSYTAEYSPTGSTLVTGNSFADMMLGMENAYSEGQIQPTAHFIQIFAALYAMDDWRASQRLTFNLGVRWEGLPHGYDKYNQTSNFVPSAYIAADAAVFNSNGSISASSPGVQTVASVPGSQIALSNTPFYLNGIELAGRNGFPRSMTRNDWGDFEPRVGLAYDVFGNGKTVVRSGVGIFYGEISDSDSNNTAGNAPFSNIASLNSVYFSNPHVSTINGQTITTPILPGSITSIRYDYPLPEVAQWSLGVQEQINPMTVATLAYVGAGGWHEQTERAIDTTPLSDPNRAAIAAGTYNANLDRIYTGYGGITQQENSTNSNYHSLQATLRLQNHRGEAVHFAYTYSKALGITSGLQSNPFDPSFDYGPTSLDQRHVFVADYILPIPLPRSWTEAVVRQALGGWQITGITSMQSGQPVTPTLAINNLGLGGGTARPNRVKRLTYPKTRLEWFDTSAYQTPVFGSFGNAGAYSIRQPGRDEWNVGVFKTFVLNQNRNANLQFRADTYNTFNHTQFATIQSGFNTSNFGQALTAYDPRVFQLSLRLGF